MKTSSRQLPHEFAPVELTITLETEEELDALYMVANYSSLVSQKIGQIRGLDTKKMQTVLSQLYVVLSQYVSS